MWWKSLHLMCWQCPLSAAPVLDGTVWDTNQCFRSLEQLLWKWKTGIWTCLTLEICEWNSVIFWPSIWPNLLSTSLCQESYFKFTFDCTYNWIKLHNSNLSALLFSVIYPCWNLMHLSQTITSSYLAIVYDNRSKFLSGFCIIKCSSCLSYLN